MPEDLEDKLDDFELMLEGFVSKCGVDEGDRGGNPSDVLLVCA